MGTSDTGGPTSSPSHVKKQPQSSRYYGRILSKFLDVSSWAFFSIDLSPLCLNDIQGHCTTGCLVVTSLYSQDNSTLKTVHISTLIRSSWRKILRSMSTDQKNELSKEIHNLVYHESDSPATTQQALDKIFSVDFLVAGADEATWLLSPVLQKFTLLRRMTMSMHQKEIGKKESHILSDCSLVDLLLDMPEIRNAVCRSLNGRLHKIQQCILNSNSDETIVSQLGQLQKMISSALQRAGFSVDPISQKAYIQTYLVPNDVAQDHAVVIQERNRLLRELQQRKEDSKMLPTHKAMNGAVELPIRLHGGTVLVTEKEMSFDAFQAEIKIADIVNRKLKRPYIPDVSRPRLTAVSIPAEGLHRLRSIFFDEDGALNKEIVRDIDRSGRHNFIIFSNHPEDRCDLRWQLPLRRHSPYEKVRTRRRVEKLLAQYGCIDESKESIHDLAMLMGGTADQSLHHDIPRQTTSFLPYDPKERQETMSEDPESMIAASGWELDRTAYNDAMASPYAPSSNLLGMGDEFKVLVGVQRNQVDQRG